MLSRPNVIMSPTVILSSELASVAKDLPDNLGRVGRSFAALRMTGAGRSG